VTDRSSPFAYRDFTLYWLAGLGLFLALELATVAIGWQVYAIRGQPLDLGLIGLAVFLPRLLLALPAGYAADRFPRRTVYALALLFQAGVFAALLVVSSSGADSLWQFVALAAASGAALAVNAPASRSIIPSLVPPPLLAKAMAQRSIGIQCALMAGPVLGGVLFAISAELVYGAAVALALAGWLAVMLAREGRAPAAAGALSLDSVFDGVRFIRRTPVVLGAISLDLFAVLFGGAIVLLPAFAKDVLHVGPVGFGVLRGAPGAGALLAALLLARRPVGRFAGQKLLGVVAVFGLSMIVFGLSRSVWLSVAALAVAGGVDMVSVVLRSTVVPLVTPPAVLGRVVAVESVFIGASNEFGGFESGLAAAVLGLVPAVVVGGVVTIAVALLWFRLFPELARVDRLEELRPAATV
jgi:MFS family permease